MILYIISMVDNASLQHTLQYVNAKEHTNGVDDGPTCISSRQARALVAWYKHHGRASQQAHSRGRTEQTKTMSLRKSNTVTNYETRLCNISLALVLQASAGELRSCQIRRIHSVDIDNQPPLSEKGREAVMYETL